MIVAIDVDGTLITYDKEPRTELVTLAAHLLHGGNRVIVWSGGGQPYAKGWADRLGLTDLGAEAMDKFRNDVEPDISIDDTDGVAIKGKLMLQIVSHK